MSPATGNDFKGIIKAAIRDPNPVVVLEHELLYNETFEMAGAKSRVVVSSLIVLCVLTVVAAETNPPNDYVTPIGKAHVELEGKVRPFPPPPPPPPFCV